jgi:hypothetical protein
LISAAQDLQRQPRRAGHQVLNRLTPPPRQGLNGASLDQLLQGLRHRGLPHLPQLHQLSVVSEGVLIRPVAPRLSLAARLEAYRPVPGEPIEAMAWDPIGAEGIE